VESISVQQAENLMRDRMQLTIDMAAWLKKREELVGEMASENPNQQNPVELYKKNEDLDAEKDLLQTRMKKIDDEILKIKSIALKIGLILTDSALQ